MKLSSIFLLIIVIFVTACTSKKLLDEQKKLQLTVKSTQSHHFSCTATQGRESISLPVLTINPGEIGKPKFQKPLRLSATPFDILFNAIDNGTGLQLTIQADADYDKAIRAVYWGPYPTDQMHVELSRYAATINCF